MFIRDLKRYYKYAMYSAASELKSQVAGSYLGWMWWILDPLLFMLVYTFVAMYVFQYQVDNFPLFVFMGITVWNFFRGDGGKLRRHNKLIFGGDEKGVYTEVHTGAHAAVREYDKDVHKSRHMSYHHNSPANTDNLKYIDDNTHIRCVFCSHIRSRLAVCVYRSVRIGLKSCIDGNDAVSLLSVRGVFTRLTGSARGSLRSTT